MPDANEINPFDAQTPWLVIPYWNADKGRPTIERPLPPTSAPGSLVPAGVLSYACPSIAVLSGTPGVFTPDVPTTVAVTVRNYGNGIVPDPVSLDLWWSPPTTEFGSLTKKPPMVQAIAGPMPRDRLGKRPPLVKNMTFTIPASAGPHICVVVRATSGSPITAFDPGGTDGVAVWPSDPTGDRHWAQRNLHRVVANSSGKFQIAFHSGNSTDRDRRYLVRANPASTRDLEILARELRATPRMAEEASLVLRPLLERRPQANREAISGERAEIGLPIRANHRMPMVLEGHLPRGLRRGEFTAFEVIQVAAAELQGQKRAYSRREHCMERGERMGSIGVVVFGNE